MRKHKPARWLLTFALGFSALLIVTPLQAVRAGDLDRTALSGGETTIFTTSTHAFSKSAANLPIEQLTDFAFGNRLFNTNWVTAPASVNQLDGLGPLFNRVSCSACHVRDGRGRPPESEDEPWMSMLMRISVRGEDEHGGPKPHPVYGGQIQDRAILGVEAEARPTVRYHEIERRLPDGTVYKLRVPTYSLRDVKYGTLEEAVLMSPRVAPAVHGLGLLEAVSEDEILSRADEQDRDGDGVSGRANYVWDAAARKHVIGRFGWKANQPSLRQQAAGAFNGDIGITTSLFPKDHVTAAQAARIDAPDGGSPELSDEYLDKIEFYLRTLAVPARRDLDDPTVQRGQRLFSQIGCAACHTPSMTSGAHELPQLSYQQIQPYTDMLLHDMGPGLADGRPDFEAGGTEWRTPPLWGIGLQKVVNRHTYFMHDGRARNLMEAILWHGGEADGARIRFESLNEADRQAIIAFLESL